MSKRFGRNQKRRLTAALRLAQHQTRESQVAERRAIRKAMACEYTMRQIEELVPDHSALLEPRELGTDHVSDFFRMHHGLPSLTKGLANHATHENAVVELLRLAVYRLKMHREAVDRMVHVELRGPDGSLGYAVSEDLLIQAPAAHVARMITRQFEPELARQIGRRRA
ncbi:hypothetical protein JN531_004000 [Flagellatimonas centrodinii]|uniref:hypothetical protein n=1 Tax=Flagellatimonas centrodinii TaxID=2806210 RepID=UPI001FFA910D|nr:hypothetical protein [Flagellatimonas centrodinii]ULQ47450.1 hypothetical protein JN531_004000 [Flagellatimonas centrodinii]